MNPFQEEGNDAIRGQLQSLGSWEVTEERVVDKRSRNSQPVGFGQPNP